MKTSDKAYINAYKERPLSQEDFQKLLLEPLWSLSTAILYLHGFQSCNEGEKSYRLETMDSECVKQIPEFKKVYQYALDSRSIGTLEIFADRFSEGRVKPLDFIKWSKTLHMDFACYLWLPKQLTVEPTKETQKPDHVTPDMQLMFDAIEKFWAGYNLSQPNPSIAPTKRMVVEWLVQEARSRKMDFSKTRAEHMDTIMRCPESRKGGNTF